MQILTADERTRAFAPPKKPEVTERQRLPVRYHVEDFDVTRPSAAVPGGLCRDPEAYQLSPRPRSLLPGQRKMRPLQHKLPDLPGYRGPERHPLRAFGVVALGLPPAFHARRHLAGATPGRPRADGRANPGDGGGLLQLHRLPALLHSNARWGSITRSSRTWAGTSSRKSASCRERWRSACASSCSARVGQHVGDTRGGAAGRAGIPQRGDAGGEGRRDPVPDRPGRRRVPVPARRFPTS